MNRIPVPDFFLHANALHSLSCYEDDITNASTSSVTLEEGEGSGREGNITFCK